MALIGFRGVRLQFASSIGACASVFRGKTVAKLVFGCGYLGLRVAQLWQAAGQAVWAVTRSPDRAANLAAQGFRPLLADIVRSDKLDIPSDVETVLFAVGFDRKGNETIHEVYVDGLARVLAALPESIQRFIYISSTGVYGGGGGDWVNEESPCGPRREGGKACLAAEELLTQSRFADRVIRLRLAGIYGPGRIPRSADLLSGKPIDAPAEGYLNLIHVEDAARIVLLAEQQATIPNLFAVSDGNPVIRSEYYEELARLLGAPAPNFILPSPETAAAQRAAADKRICNRRLLEQLAPELKFPSYREGLAAIVAAAKTE